MGLTFWLRNVKSACGFGQAAGNGRRATRYRPAPRCRLHLEALEDRTLPSTFTVLNLADSGAGSLRQAVLDANANPGADVIAFAVGGGVQTIAPTSALPLVTDPVTLDGWTQPGFAGTPLLELNGAGAGPADGPVITAGN